MRWSTCCSSRPESHCGLPVLETLPAPEWFGTGAKLGYVVSVRSVEMVLGNVLLWVAAAPLYAPYAGGHWSISAATDQSLAGAVMLAEGTLVTLTVLAALFCGSSRRRRHGRSSSNGASSRAALAVRSGTVAGTGSPDRSDGMSSPPRGHLGVRRGRRRTSSAHSGHLVRGVVRPTLEMILLESPAHLRMRVDLALQEGLASTRIQAVADESLGATTSVQTNRVRPSSCPCSSTSHSAPRITYVSPSTISFPPIWGNPSPLLSRSSVWSPSGWRKTSWKRVRLSTSSRPSWRVGREGSGRRGRTDWLAGVYGFRVLA